MDIEYRETVDLDLNALRDAGLPVSLPAEFSEYAVFVHVMRLSGALDTLKGAVLSRRAGSFELIDIVLFFAAYFTASPKDTSIVAFAEASAPYGNELAAIADRAGWPSQASVSRGLAAISYENAQLVSRCLLGLTSQLVCKAALCEATGYRDGAGQAWKVLHWDASADTVRQRALPQGDDLPEARRHTTDLASPGYAGRKRGEGVFSRSIVSDATSSAWLHMELGCGSGSVTDQVESALRSVHAHLGDGDPDRCLIVCDGVSGGAPQTLTVLNAGLHVLTRNISYERLETPRALALMSKSTWLPVEDSRSGPRREAIDLGTQITAKRKVRVIASRFPVRPGKKQRGAGKTIGAWHYELFVSTLPKEGWAANDLVTLYYGRTAIENRLSAEDREFNLSRVFACSCPGQMLASAVGMALWNLRIAIGLRTVSEKASPRRARPRFPDTSATPVKHSTSLNFEVIDDPDFVMENIAVPIAKIPASSTHGTTRSDSVSDAEPSRGQTDSSAEEPLAEPGDTSEPTDSAADDESALRENIERWCLTRPGWSGVDGSILCPAGLRLQRTYRSRGEKAVARFRGTVGECGTCELQARCTTRQSKTFRKEVTIPITRAPAAETPKTRPESAESCQFLDEQPALPPLLPDAPTLVPSVLRKRAVKLISTTRLKVTAPIAQVEELPDDEHDAPDPESRQRRRWTITERVAANSRAGANLGRTTLQASADCMKMLERLQSAILSA